MWKPANSGAHRRSSDARRVREDGKGEEKKTKRANRKQKLVIVSRNEVRSTEMTPVKSYESCPLCGSGSIEHVRGFSYCNPDKYESAVGIELASRIWVKCLECGLYMAESSYEPFEMQVMYENQYRKEEFRSETIAEAFTRINSITGSENTFRSMWFAPRCGSRRELLDIGSGIGVFPYAMKELAFDVTCWEPNIESVDFMRNELGMDVLDGFFPHEGKTAGKTWQVISMIHVLEHQEDPVWFLKSARQFMDEDGLLLIEIPNAKEFEYLNPDHDEFNSCHLFFFDEITIGKVLRKAGFHVVDMNMVRYEDRNLTRIMLIAKQG